MNIIILIYEYTDIVVVGEGQSITKLMKLHDNMRSDNSMETKGIMEPR